MTSAPVLVVTRDETLLEDLLRLAAAAGSRLEVARETTSALRGWSTAGLVLLGADLLAALAEQHPPRRDQVHVLTRTPPDPGVFQAALAAGALDVVELPAADRWLVELLTDAGDSRGATVGVGGRTVGVLGGCGGVGASTFAAALACVGAAGGSSALVDLDPLGAGLDRLVGLDEVAGVRWDALVASRGRLGSRSLRTALPGRDGLRVLTWDLAAPVHLETAAVREVLSAAQRGHDLVVLDLPRGLDEVSAEAATRCDVLVLVVEPTLAGVAATGKVLGELRPLTGRVVAVVCSGRPGGGGLPAEQVTAALGLPLVAEAPHQRRLDEQVGLGLGPVHGRRSGLSRAARRTLAAVEELVGVEVPSASPISPVASGVVSTAPFPA